MRKLFVLVLFLLLLTTNGTFAADICTDVTGIPNIPIYRLYHPVTGEHLYTPSEEEVKTAVTQNWKREGEAWHAPRSGQAVYRLYDPKHNNHLYTTDENEVNILTSQRGWVKDFNGFPCFYSGGQYDIYRLYNPRLGGLHHLTTDINEYNILPYSDWVKEGSKLRATTPTFSQKYPIGKYDITDVPSEYTIQADVTLAGNGSGQHAKLVLATPTSAISFGIQYDIAAAGPYQDTTAFLIENVKSNKPGGQIYTRTGYAAKGRTFRLMIALKKDGNANCYINGTRVCSIFNEYLREQQVTLRLEGSGRVNGDSVTADFSNIKLKKDGVYDENRAWLVDIQDTNDNIKSNIENFNEKRAIRISGSVVGLTREQDWDSAYNKVSGVADFY